MNGHRILTSVLALALLLTLAVGLSRAEGPTLSQPSPYQGEGRVGVGISSLAPLGTAFTYQGQLIQSGSPVNGTCDFRFSLWDAVSGGTQIGTTQTKTNVSVTNGLFTIPDLDFDSGAFIGDARWLEIAARCPAGSGSYTTLSPRQALTPAPYALALPGLWTQQNATSPNLIGGYSGNSATSGVVGATIGGGGSSGSTNRVTDNYGTVGGGRGNTASGGLATVGGGWGNEASGGLATVGGGYDNTASDSYATVGGGRFNTASEGLATVGGGEANIASGWHATVGGGWGNEARGWYATVGGGYFNAASGYTSTIGGGQNNTASGPAATVGGGGENTASGDWATVGGGYSNTASDYAATVGGGRDNTASYDFATVGGGLGNEGSGYAATIAGGFYNTASGRYTTVGGGFVNIASGDWVTVGGGQNNRVSGDYATVSGGYINTASGDYATVPGGSGAAASRYGQMAYASGEFASNGDAQTSLYVLRNTTTDATPKDLFLDGLSSQRLTIAANSTLTFDILVVARSNGGASAGYHILGVIENTGGATAFVGTPTVTTLGEEVARWNVAVWADDTNDALLIRVTGAADTTIRWVATTRTAEVAW